MSSIPPLSGGKPTSGKPATTAAFDVEDDARSRHRMCQRGSLNNESPEGVVHMQVSPIGVDLAKNVFQMHGVDNAGKVVITRQLRRKQVIARFLLALSVWKRGEAL